MASSTVALRSNVQNRSSSDRIIRGAASLILVFLFLAFIVAFQWMGVNPTYTAVFSFDMLGLVIAAFCYNLHMRSVDHVNRDRRWALAVIGCMEDFGIPVEAFAPEKREFSRPQMRRLRIVRVLVWACVAVFPVSVCYMALETAGLPEGEIFGWAAPVDWAVTLAPLIIAAVVMVICAKGVFFEPVVHDARQVEFTRKVSSHLEACGLIVDPMPPSVRSHRRVHAAVLALLFAGSVAGMYLLGTPVLILPVFIVVSLGYLMFLYFFAVGGMNRHILSQWSYEEYLLQRLDSILALDDEHADDAWDPFYDVDSYREKMRIPPVLRLAEAFLLVVCVINLVKLFASGVDVTAGYYGGTFRIGEGRFTEFYLMGLMYGVTFLISFNSLVGIKSRQPESWRKVMTTSITFSASVIIMAFVLTSSSFIHYFDFNPFITIGVLYNVVLAMLLLDSVKGYYTPFGKAVPPTRDWARYAVTGRISFCEPTTAVEDPHDGSFGNRLTLVKSEDYQDNFRVDYVHVRERLSSGFYVKRYVVEFTAPEAVLGGKGTGFVFTLDHSGRTVPPGGTARFCVTGGMHTLVVAQLTDGGPSPEFRYERTMVVYGRVGVSLRPDAATDTYAVFVRNGSRVDMCQISRA